MRVYLGSDHAGFELKGALIARLTESGREAVDCGPSEYVAIDDYPTHCIAAALRVAADPGSLGIVIGGSGNGEQIAANKVRGIRAALAYDLETARLGRQHNDANVLGLGARMHTQDQAFAIVDTFLDTPFSQDPRHLRRIEMVAEYEQTGKVPT
ncbi:MAG: ribose 5-phosphate isomerase [Pseudonocardiales bacterium]|nr:ribose 5-phosphate isomerase [Pseudonocardiales bacterium]